VKTGVGRVVSGGQTGVDRAALDAALRTGIACGGWCPKGRLAEDGSIDGRYPLRETPSAAFAQRTEWNVRDSDATLLLSPWPLEGGTALTAALAQRFEKPCLVVDPGEENALETAASWLEQKSPEILNVAGPRASRWPEGYAVSVAFLLMLFERLSARRDAA
jgi:hypothetical protein